MPTYASHMKPDTNMVIIACFCFLGVWGEVNLSHFLRCYVWCYCMILSIFYSKLQMVLSFCKRSSDLAYIFLFLHFEHFIIQIYTHVIIF